MYFLELIKENDNCEEDQLSAYTNPREPTYIWLSTDRFCQLPAFLETVISSRGTDKA